MKWPNEFVPALPDDLLSPASDLATRSIAHAKRIAHDPKAHFKVCFYGPRGTGKTSLVNMVADMLAAHPTDIQRINGRNVTIEVVREWQIGSHYLFGGWQVKIINELDLVPMAAQELMLSCLDELPPRFAVIGTSNEDASTLSERFVSRFQAVKVSAPDQDTLKAWLVRKWKLPKSAAHWIALSSCGDVRQALNQATSYLQFGILPEEPKAKPTKCAARAAIANRYWQEVREGLRPAPGMAA
ncbi:MAG TPA: ATP-binding protein [Verrucomicrobiae bacterium]|nr:ATP-binding protein [Verrucomicrobiae bacterium]